jgi:D-sedoheptulose 7-phosphate isomerase
MPIDQIKKSLQESAAVKIKTAEMLAEKIERISVILADSLKTDNKALFCGNGGSAADSQHLATELVVRLSSKINRRALPAIALTTNTSLLTACGNDYGFEQIFSRQIEALANPADILFAISTSGNSPNIIKAVETARKIGVITVGFLGGNGGKLAQMVDHPLIVPSDNTQYIQECHIAIGHILIAEAEQLLGFK